MANLISSLGRPACRRNPKEAVVIPVLIATMTFLAPAICRAQEPEHSLEKSKNEFSMWAGSSLGLPTALGGGRDRKIALLIGLRYGRVLGAGKYAALEYTFDLVPVALVSAPKGGFSNPGGAASPGGGRDYAYGAGFIPVGFK